MAVELRTVNSRFLDLSLKLPDELKGLESGLRDLLTAGLRRGKVELRVVVQTPAQSGEVETNLNVLQRLAALQTEVWRHLPQATPLSVHEALQWSRQQSTAVAALDDATLNQAVKDCLAALQDARRREGEKLKAVLLERVARLRQLAAQAEPLVPAVIKRQQTRFVERWHEALQLANSATAGGPTPDDTAARDRALQEATAFAIRIDVAEELARLTVHLDEIERLLHQGGELGKRLDFLTQELHREANTMGSKSAALELSTLSMEMKVLIEQMREQVQNIE